MLEYFLSHFGLFLEGVKISRYLVGSSFFFVLIRMVILAVTLFKLPLLHSQVCLSLFCQLKQILLPTATL